MKRERKQDLIKSGAAPKLPRLVVPTRLKLDDALWAFRTAYKTPTDTTPYKLKYGKNCHLPFEIEHRAYWALKNCNPDLIVAGEKRMFQLHDLDELRHQAYENSRLYKTRWTPYAASSPPSPYYIHGLEEPHDPDYVPEPIYPKYMPLEDEHSDPEEDPEEYEDDETKDGLVDYPIYGRDDGDDDEEDSSRDDADDEDEDEEDKKEEEEEEPLALADSTVSYSTTITTYLTLRIASTQALIDVVTAALPSPLVPPVPPSLYIPPSVDPPYLIPTQSCLDAEARRQGIVEVGYGIRDTWVDPAEAVPEIAPMTLEEDSRTRISQRVTTDSQWVDLLMEDRIAYRETILIVEEDAYTIQEAWAHSIGLSQAVHSKLQTHYEQTQHQVHETRFHMQQTKMAELRETDRRRQAQMTRRASQPRLDARVPDHQDASRDADSHI
uniref:Reverse transcriptase domain-containing protein n=1 Tax=Tanacetum cinerariifolium TaxID=118510 RepID=A0A6L2IZT2_TANCI|nr:reverse transcriptase domain-containing protein [Tanacetum cinerariifolium]